MVFSDEHKHKLSIARRNNIKRGIIGGMSGKRHSEETKKKLSEIVRKEMRLHPRSGWKPTEETRRNMSIAKKENPIIWTKEKRKRLVEGQKKGWNNPIFRLKRCRSQKESWKNEEKRKIRLRYITTEYLKSMSDTTKRLIKENPKYFYQCSLKGAIACRKKMGSKLKTSIENKTEKIIKELNLPYKYTGDGKIWIENFNPDFVNTNGQKKVIEVLGSYWHNEEETKERIGTFKGYGYAMLPIWDYELEDIEKVKEKIVEFDKVV